MKWNEMKWNEMKWNEMKWNEKNNQIVFYKNSKKEKKISKSGKNAIIQKYEKKEFLTSDYAPPRSKNRSQSLRAQKMSSDVYQIRSRFSNCPRFYTLIHQNTSYGIFIQEDQILHNLRHLKWPKIIQNCTSILQHHPGPSLKKESFSRLKNKVMKYKQ